MAAARPLFIAGLSGLALAGLAGVAASTPTPLAGLDWAWSHGAVAFLAFLLPTLAGAHVHALETLWQRQVPAAKTQRLAVLYFTGGLLWGLGHLLQPSNAFSVVAFVGLLLTLAAGGMQTGLVLRLAPKRGQSVVDVARDPLTKGDDACAMQVRFSHFVLPLGLLLLAAAYAPGLGGWDGVVRLRLAGLHILLAGYALWSTYALTHLWIPRLSGVPAIAAGAIKGELHSSLLGILLLTAGFLSGLRGLTIAGGAFLFFGAFTWMGVLGANIMRNKSRTQRVTPEFVYVPWVFTGVFWLLSGVLLGIFLNAVPELFADRLPALRFTHVHMALLGGFVQTGVGLATRLVPMAKRLASPPPFQALRWAFFAFNGGLAAMLWAQLAGRGLSTAFAVGVLLLTVGLAVAFMTLWRHGRQAQGA